MNYHALNDFRSGNEALMDEVLTANVAALASVGAISLEQPLVEAGELVKDIRRPGGQAAQRRQAAGRTRERMASDAAKDVYKQRAATAECVNALARNRGLQRMGLDGRANASDHLPADRSASIKCFSGSEAP